MSNNSLWVIDNIDIKKLLLNYSISQHIYPEGSFIFHQDEVQEYLHFIIKGRIKVGIIDTKGSEKTLAIHEPGSFFGETAFFDQQHTFTSAQALIESTIIKITKDQFNKIIVDNPEIAFQLFSSMGRKIRLLSFQVEAMTFLKIEQRVASLLLSLLDSFASECTPNNYNCKVSGKCTDGQHIKITITDQEISEMIGTRREAVTKAISTLKKLSLICKHNRTISCPDTSKLRDFLSD